MPISGVTWPQPRSSLDVSPEASTECCHRIVLVSPLTDVHVDHALVRTAAERHATTHDTELLYYADEPYSALWPAASARAREGLQAVEVGRGPVASMVIRSLLAPLAAFVGERDLGRLHAARELRNGRAAPLWRAAPGLSPPTNGRG